MAKQKSKKKVQTQHKQKVEKQRKIMADQETDVVGNNGEPQAPEVNEDAQKDEQIMATVPEELEPEPYPTAEDLDEDAKLGIEKPFDPKNAIADILKKHGV